MVEERNWEKVQLGDILSVRHGKSQHQVVNSNGVYPIFGTGGLMGWADEFLYDKPSVLIGRKGTINRPQYFDKPFWTIDTLFYTEINKNVSAKYIYYLFNTIDWYSHNEASGVPSLNSKVIEKISILLPSLEEQKVIAKALTDTDNLIHSIQNLINKKEKIKQGTMQELLTGKKRLDGFSGEWENIKLGEIDLFISDGNYGELYPRPNEFVESGVPFLRANNIYKNNVVGKDLRFISNEKHQLLKSGHLKEADILITTRGDIGNTAIVPKEFDGSNINAQICLIRVNEKEKVNAMFIHYSLISNYVQNQIKTLQTGSALKQLPKGNLGKIEFKLPEIKEQKSISQILSHMDQEIQGLKEKLEKYKTIKQGMMQELLTGRIRLI